MVPTGAMISSQVVTTFAANVSVSVDTAVAPDGSYIVLQTRHDNGCHQWFFDIPAPTSSLPHSNYGSIPQHRLATIISYRQLTSIPMGMLFSSRRIRLSVAMVLSVGRFFDTQGSLLSSEVLDTGPILKGTFSLEDFPPTCSPTSGGRSYATLLEYSSMSTQRCGQQGILTDLPNSFLFFGISRIAGMDSVRWW